MLAHLKILQIFWKSKDKNSVNPKSCKLYLDITSVICFWPHKIQIHSVYSNVFSSKYKLSIFSYQQPNWWNHAKRRRTARDPRPQVLSPSHADPPPPAWTPAPWTTRHISKLLVTPDEQKTEKIKNSTSTPKVPEFLRGKHQSNIGENPQFP